MNFRVGDWVVGKYEHGAEFVCFQINNIKAETINGKQYSVIESDVYSYPAKSCELWKPKEGEYCWFWNDNQLLNNGSPHFGQYGVLSYTEEFYKHCEPFTANLPTFTTKIRYNTRG